MKPIEKLHWMATPVITLAMADQDAYQTSRKAARSCHPPQVRRSIATPCLTLRAGPGRGCRAVQIRCSREQTQGTRDGCTTQEPRVDHSSHVSSMICFGYGKIMFKGSISGAT